MSARSTKRSASVEAEHNRKRRILIRLLARLGPELLAVSKAAGRLPGEALPYLRTARRAIDAAIVRLSRRAA